jgi:tetratricopeptide (TPR) repeat protein
MMIRRLLTETLSLRPIAVTLLAVLALAACDSAEERAEEHYKRGMALLEDGETAKALIEFRNVFKLNGQHLPARLAYAGELVKQGKLQLASRQYLRVVEQDSQNLKARRELSKLMILFRQFDQAKTHVEAAYALAPEDVELMGLKATVDYRSGDKEGALKLVDEVLAKDPENVAVKVIQVTDAIDREEFEEALAYSEQALAIRPNDQGIRLLRLRVLEQKNDIQGIGAELKEMVELFPDNPRFKEALIRWHISQDDPDSAEAILRKVAENNPDNAQAAMRVVGFVAAQEGEEAARDELLRLTGATDNPDPLFQHELARLDFQLGDRDGAIERLRALASKQSGDQVNLRATQSILSAMLRQTGDLEGSRALVDEILEADASNVEALKQRAQFLIDDDKPEAAIRDLRTALDGSPQDPDIFSLLAVAHDRNGSKDLAGERLALAVQASKNAPGESVRYAGFLAQGGKPEIAENVLLDSLEANPRSLLLLQALGQLRINQENWNGAAQIAERLRQLGSDAAAEAVEVGISNGQQNYDESISKLLSLTEQNPNNPSAMTNLVQTYVRNGKPEDAEAFLNRTLQSSPDNTRASLLLAGLYATIMNLPDKAEAIYRDQIAKRPTVAASYSALAALYNQQDRREDAEKIIDEGFKANPGSIQLAILRASLFEQRQDFEAAISIYETVYERNKASPVIANNLASLLSEHRTDAESLEKAYAVAKRLRSSQSPAFQDTYGWLLYRRGEYERALAFLKPASEGLADNPLVQFHLGMTYAKLNQTADARTHLEKALQLSGGAYAEQMEEAKAALSTLN